MSEWNERQFRLEVALGRKIPRLPVQDLDRGDEICDIDHFPPKNFTGIVATTEIIGRGETIRIVLENGFRFERPYNHTVLVGPGLCEHYL